MNEVIGTYLAVRRAVLQQLLVYIFRSLSICCRCVEHIIFRKSVVRSRRRSSRRKKQRTSLGFASNDDYGAA
ncbi:hypothetical protein V1264_017060 [Littorina saxatilis]|uniref:Uncharacterized protein n=1 Tax=Littorina saxatilis TaxID=31220 RepID=A0AAN9BGF9_9CAEN